MIKRSFNLLGVDLRKGDLIKKVSTRLHFNLDGGINAGFFVS